MSQEEKQQSTGWSDFLEGTPKRVESASRGTEHARLSAERRPSVERGSAEFSRTNAGSTEVSRPNVRPNAPERIGLVRVPDTRPRGLTPAPRQRDAASSRPLHAISQRNETAPLSSAGAGNPNKKH